MYHFHASNFRVSLLVTEDKEPKFKECLNGKFSIKLIFGK